MRSERALLVAVTLLTLTASPPASAENAEAEARTKHGIELRRLRRDADALDEFRRAYTLEPSPRLLVQIALAEQALGRWVSAEADLLRALGADSEPWIARQRALLESELVTIRAHLGWLEVSVDAPHAEVWVNGSRADARPLRVEAGSLLVEVKAEGYTSARQETSVKAGERARLDVHLAPLPAPSARAAAPSPKNHALAGSSGTRSAGFIFLGAGAAALAAGAYFGVRTLSVKGDRDAHCSGQMCDATGVALDGEARTLALRSTAWFLAGVGAAGGGAVLLWVSRSRRLEVDPEVGADRAGIRVGGAF